MTVRTGMPVQGASGQEGADETELPPPRRAQAPDRVGFGNATPRTPELGALRETRGWWVCLGRRIWGGALKEGWPSSGESRGLPHISRLL